MVNGTRLFPSSGSAMAAASPTSAVDFLDLLRKSRIWPEDQLAAQMGAVGELPDDPTQAAALLVRHGVLTPFQARVLLAGKYRGFRLGAYVVRDQVGQGGMGAVYLAQHETLRRPVALKVLQPTEKGPLSKVNVGRFLREARAAAALDHPNIVRIFDVGQVGATHFLVMEYVEGKTLDEIVTGGGPVACGRAVEYILQAAAGLEHAYQKGFVHRDIKPSNLILAKDGTLKILDMGLARTDDATDQVTEVFDRGAVVGTADYISPEQAMNAPGLDIRADIYSLGATFFTLVTGKPPFSGNTTQKLMQHQIQEAPSLSVIDKTFPADLAAVVAKMMKKKPADRYQTPGDVMAALGPWLSNNSQVVSALSRTASAGGTSRSSTELQQTLNEVVGGSTKRLPHVAGKRGRRSALPYAVGGAAALLLTLAVAAAGAYALSGPGPKPAPQASLTAAGQPASAVTPPDAAATPEAKLLPAPVPRVGPAFSFSAAGLAEFREQWRITGSKLSNGRPENAVLGHTGDGKLPKGWDRVSWSTTTVSEVAVAEVEGVKALGMATLEGEHTTMLFSPLFQTSGPDLVAEIEYLTEGDTGTLEFKFGGATPRPAVGPDYWQLAELPATRGKWSKRVVPVDARKSATGRLEFHTHTLESGKPFWIKSVTVRQGAPATTAPRDATREVLYQLSLASVEPFRERGTTPVAGQPEQVVLERTGDGRLPADCRVSNWDVSSEYLVTVGEHAGQKAIGVCTVTSKPSTMLFTPKVEFRPGKVRVRVEYALETAATNASVRMRQTLPSYGEVWDVAALIGTGGAWETAEFEADTRGATGGQFEFHTTPLNLNETLWIKSVTVYVAPE
jgi:serine/threonine protein kinase